MSETVVQMIERKAQRKAELEARMRDAAPDLYAALKALRDDEWRMDPSWGASAERRPILAQVDKALRKAKLKPRGPRCR